MPRLQDCLQGLLPVSIDLVFDSLPQPFTQVLRRIQGGAQAVVQAGDLHRLQRGRRRVSHLHLISSRQSGDPRPKPPPGAISSLLKLSCQAHPEPLISNRLGLGLQFRVSDPQTREPRMDIRRVCKSSRPDVAPSAAAHSAGWSGAREHGVRMALRLRICTCAKCGHRKTRRRGTVGISMEAGRLDMLNLPFLSETVSILHKVRLRKN